jgi:large subunit ribosomal protein L4
MDVLSIEGKKAGDVELPGELFDARVSEHAVYRAVVAYETNQRQGNASAKGRSEVNRSGRKHHRQKGTGMARRGTGATNLLRGGGVAFGHPKPRNYQAKVTKSVKRLALGSALTDKSRSDKIKIVDDFDFETPSTKSFVAIVKACGLSGQKVLFVIPENQPVVVKSCRNVPNVVVRSAQGVGTYDIVASDVLLLTRKAVDALMLARGDKAES